MRFACVGSDSRLVAERRDEILALIKESSLLVDRDEVEALFAPGRDFVLALQRQRIVGVTVAMRRRVASELYIGFLLAIVRPEARQCGLLGKMTARFFLRSVPSIVWMKVRRRRSRIYLFADISNPVSYHRLHIGQRSIYPDLVRGTETIDLTRLAALRTRLATAIGLKGLDPATGTLRDGVGAKEPERPNSAGIDIAWATPWRQYVPKGSDLLTIVPVELDELLRRFAAIVRISVQGRTRQAAGAGAALAERSCP